MENTQHKTKWLKILKNSIDEIIAQKPADASRNNSMIVLAHNAEGENLNLAYGDTLNLLANICMAFDNSPQIKELFEFAIEAHNAFKLLENAKIDANREAGEADEEGK